eukprot:UN15488
MESYKWELPGTSWNIHVIPQYEYLRGYRLDYIGCIPIYRKILRI